MSNRPFVVVAVGMLAEARIAGRDGCVRAVAGGGDCTFLSAAIERAADRNAIGILSFGIAGGLAPQAKPGDIIIASGIAVDGKLWATDDDWSARLHGALPQAKSGLLAGSDTPIATVAAKSALFAATNAIAVDMESHIAARIAAAHSLPFAALRVVADAASRELPPAALAGLSPGGAINIVNVLKSLARQPSQLPALLGVSVDTRTAMKALLGSFRAVNSALGAGFGCPRLGCRSFGTRLGSADL